MKRVVWIGLAVVLAALAAPAAGAATAKRTQAKAPHTATPRYDAHTVIVKYADRASAAQRVLARGVAGVIEMLGTVRGVGAHVVRVPVILRLWRRA